MNTFIPPSLDISKKLLCQIKKYGCKMTKLSNKINKLLLLSLSTNNFDLLISKIPKNVKMTFYDTDGNVIFSNNNSILSINKILMTLNSNNNVLTFSSYKTFIKDDIKMSKTGFIYKIITPNFLIQKSLTETEFSVSTIEIVYELLIISEP